MVSRRQFKSVDEIPQPRPTRETRFDERYENNTAEPHANNLAELHANNTAELPNHCLPAELHGNPMDHQGFAQRQNQNASFHVQQYQSYLPATMGHAPSSFEPSLVSQAGNVFSHYQPSISSVQSSFNGDTPLVFAPEQPIYATQVTASPTEQTRTIAPCDTNTLMQHSFPQRPLFTMAELDGSSSYPVSGTAMNELDGRPLLSELDAAPRRAELEAESVMPQQPRELPSATEITIGFNTGGWNSPQTTGTDGRSMMAQLEECRPARPALYTDLPPLISHDSFDSRAETLIDTREQSPTSTLVATPPASAPEVLSTVACNGRRTARQQVNEQMGNNNVLYCEPCDYHPSGKEPRRMLIRHYKTDRHLYNTRQPPAEKHSCPFPFCRAMRNRKDNVHSHIKKDHGKQAMQQRSQAFIEHMQVPLLSQMPPLQPPPPPPQQQQQQQQRKRSGKSLKRMVQRAVSKRRVRRENHTSS
ncbi:hypothetical protein VTH82DRAFT_5325 [Thermothelomyces myriococcoides]